MTSIAHPIIRYHGGKFCIVDWIISKFPDLGLDHIEPEFKGGDSSSENLQTMCRSCNLAKGAKYDGVDRRDL
ncbi:MULTISPECIES: HNH endonuclease [unclassified Acinetobacter]|uniref:HNH endonuclease n=1 Tax=unclassified Acinetobacter TaxID=196816 RepID=UPI00190A656A|nr:MULTISPECIES: HNH endonuclease [unclassified Acinetobacter]MBK0062172.1 HNH endonuclease [Acinetobacter sp. S55]MBK0065976.1 HNH endonuclease [Acinetobacter sp. S54]